MRKIEIENGLKNQNYIPSNDILYALLSSINQKAPLLIEGAPGVGKTSLAKVVADMLGVPFFRIQFYEGLTADKILYDYDYQKQLLTIETIKSSIEDNLKNTTIEEAMEKVSEIDFYGKDFLIKRPVLNAITQDRSCVLLLDEIDKASEEIEYTLLEVLDEFALTIPQYGTIKCKEELKPIVFLTSNNYRQLSDALKRRCHYLYIEEKSVEEMVQIINSKTKVSTKLANGIAKCINEIRELDLEQVPSISEAISWANFLYDNKEDLDNAENSLSTIIKNKNDLTKVLESGVVRKHLGEF